MTFPHDSSINAYIIKNGVYGVECSHSLPTVEALADDIRSMGRGVYLSSIDVSRAYKNFTSDPLDWPLLCFAWDKKYFRDLSMPFGAPASSLHMQSVANCVTDVLAMQGVRSFMYLDDLIILSSDRDIAWRDYTAAQQLLHDLGLPEAEDKAQPPTTRIKWLCITIDTCDMTLSIPQAKLASILLQVREVYNNKCITKRKLQSLLGSLLFIAKCVRPARAFVSRMLHALRSVATDCIDINQAFRPDLSWFIQFCSEWNGIAIIPAPTPTKCILMDACLGGVGGTDGQRAYTTQIAPSEDGVANITELEMANVVLALHTLLTKEDQGTHVTTRQRSVFLRPVGQITLCCRIVHEQYGWLRPYLGSTSHMTTSRGMRMTWLMPSAEHTFPGGTGRRVTIG